MCPGPFLVHGDFNTSPSTRGFATHDAVVHPFIFQYQPLHEGLQGLPGSQAADEYFNTSPSTRGFLVPVLSRTFVYISIPAPPRGASECASRSEGMDHISIPAPPRGASAGSGIKDFQLLISIPAPPRGASEVQPGLKSSQRFQYQPLHEGLLVACESSDVEGISIPAPPRGASKLNGIVFLFFDFNTSPSTRGFTSPGES